MLCASSKTRGGKRNSLHHQSKTWRASKSRKVSGETGVALASKRQKSGQLEQKMACGVLGSETPHAISISARVGLRWTQILFPWDTAHLSVLFEGKVYGVTERK